MGVFQGFQGFQGRPSPFQGFQGPLDTLSSFGLVKLIALKLLAELIVNSATSLYNYMY